MTFKEGTEKIEQYKDFPYCMVGSSVVEPSFSITMTAEGIKAIADKLNKGDLLHITIHAGYKATEFSISRFIESSGTESQRDKR